MKKLIHLLIISSFVLSVGLSFPWEFGLRVMDENGDGEIKHVKLYKLDDPLNPFRDGYTTGDLVGNPPADINGKSDMLFPNGDTIVPTIQDDFIIWEAFRSQEKYYIRIDDRYCTLDIPTPTPGEQNDFVVQYQDREFSIDPDNNSLDVSCDYTNDWPYALIEQKNSSLQSFGQVDIFLDHYDVYTQTQYNGLYSFNVPTTINTDDYNVAFIRSDQDLTNSEKYHHWINQSDVVNPDTYNLVQHSYITNPFTAFFKEVACITIETDLIYQSNNIVYFRDPWYIDNSITYENITSPVNRGTNAIFHELQTPITLDENSGYNGVFLGENESFNPQYPIYSLSAPRLIADEDNIGVFDRWVAYEDDGATEDTGELWAKFDDDNNYDECRVVFKQSGAVIKAEYVAANRITGNEIVIGSTEELSIPAGADISMKDEVKITVDGILNIVGTKAEPILLTCNGVGNDSEMALIKVRNGGVLQLEHTEIEFTASSTRPNIICENGSEAHLEYVNLITNKTALRIGDATVTYSYGVISTDISNSSVEMIDIDLSLTTTDISLDHLTIDGVNNYGTGIHANFIGPNFNKTERYVNVNNTIINDFATGVYYETDEWNGLLRIKYSLLDNTTNFNGYPDRQYLIEGDDPLLLSDYSLSQSSPCIDEGDPNSPDDPDGTRADMGAIYYDAIPSAPTNFAVSGNVGQHPTLNWTLGTDLDIAGYEVWRRLTDAGTQYYLRATVSNTADEYVDTELTIAEGGKFVPGACYKIRAVDNIDQVSTFIPIRCKPYGAVGKELADLVPEQFAIHPNYPNPFNPNTTIPYDLPEDSRVVIKIYDFLGREVCTLIDGNEYAGYKNVVWRGMDNGGYPVASGIYLVVINLVGTENDAQLAATRKLILMK